MIPDEREGGDPALRAKVDAYERSVPAEARRSTGVHYTPPGVAATLCRIGMRVLGRTPRSVVDPSCGGGAFLLAAADELVAAGVPPAEVVTERLSGVDIDADAVSLARNVLSDWAAERGVQVGAHEVQIHRVDALLVEPLDWPARPSGGHDLVIGNPPFLGQLDTRTSRSSTRRSRLRERFAWMGPYTDDAALFLSASIDLVAPEGVVALVQPQSVLSSRDTEGLRSSLCRRGDLVVLWVHEGLPFDQADVHVCAPVLRRMGSTAPPPGGSVEVVWQGAGEEVRRWQCAPGARERWGELLAVGHGVPAVGTLEGPRLGSIATATAGFRDEFYALCAAADDTSAGDPGTIGRRLVTVGMIDPFLLRWGTGSFRLGGRKMSSPVLDEGRLRAANPAVSRWVERRSAAKVLVATQTRIIEVVVDADGDLVPVTPTISIEPIDRSGVGCDKADGPGGATGAGSADVWHLGAALSAPPVAAHAALGRLGSGRSPGSLRWSARSLLDLPLPVDGDAWSTGALLVRELTMTDHDAHGRDRLLDRFARTMSAAHGLDEDHDVVEWWSSRRPRR